MKDLATRKECFEEFQSQGDTYVLIMDEGNKCGKVSQIDPLIFSTSTETSKCSSPCIDDSGSSDCAGPNEMMVYELSSDANSDAIMGLKAYPSATQHDNSYSYLK